MTSFGARKDYSLSCAGPAHVFDVVASVTIPPGGPRSLDVWATTNVAAVAVAIQRTCGDGGTEVACGGALPTSAARVRARSLDPGTYAVVVSTTAEAQ